VIRYNQTATSRYPDLAKIVGRTSAEELAQEIEKLRTSVNNIGSLKAFGISREDWEKNLDFISKML
jgi:alcohol dehydrogenase class IV